MQLSDCHNVSDFRALARKRLPYPVFHYIDGAADDEITKGRNSTAFDSCDLVPNVLAGVADVDMSTTIMGKRVSMPLFLSPTALQRLFHWEGERAVGRAASAFNTWFGISSLATVSLEEIGATVTAPKMFQLYVHKDEGLNRELISRARDSGFDALTLTVDTIVGGNRERCLRTGFTSPPKVTPRNALSYAAHPGWTLNYLFRESFSLPNLAGHLAEGSRVAMSVGDYFTKMLDQSLDWKRAEAIRAAWGDRPFCLKGVMSVDDARRAIDIGASAIMVSNHGGRQLDGSRAPFDQLTEIVDAVGDRIEVICDGGVRRGTHVLKALAAGATACSGGRLYLYALAAAGEAGVHRILSRLRDEIERDMKLMGVTRPDQLDRSHLRWR
ncbi:alpha-hydroxy acid oxidase [Sandaracinobacteroides sp. A072]|uniref:alpha-hydroxy acid oxidase n=1 Tax=Sandaracinobacteroides sp. A072 TaxID=3461146 RepID=UPI0040428368